MNNVYSRKLQIPFDLALSKVTESLSRRGFGIVTTINIRETFKKKLNVEFRNYTILGACSPEFAYKAISLDSHVGNILPCNVLVQQHENGEIEISAINPMESLDRTLNTAALSAIANDVSTLLRAALDDLHKGNQSTTLVEALPRPEVVTA